jgi:hypothetical protein
MRRLASDVIRELEVRIARLEKQASRYQSRYTGDVDRMFVDSLKRGISSDCATFKGFYTMESPKRSNRDSMLSVRADFEYKKGSSPFAPVQMLAFQLTKNMDTAKVSYGVATKEPTSSRDWQKQPDLKTMIANLSKWCTKHEVRKP